MKKIFYLLGLSLLIASCTNQDIDFDDFEYQTVYFPFQSPLRSLMLGDEVIGDNSIDLEHAFTIGASMGGVYENGENRELTIELAPDLAMNITDGNDKPLAILPTSHYEAIFDKITIPAGSFIGGVKVNLTDAFFADPLTTELNYVLPVRITEAKDSILQGIPTDLAGPNADPRVSDDWVVAPKDYVLFGIKYINPTHGAYLLRGERTNLSDNSKLSYSERFLHDNDVTKLTTGSLTENYMPTIGGLSKEGTDAKYSMLLTFDDDAKTVAVSQKDASTVVVSGTGTYFSKDDSESEEYNGKKHRTIYLDYTYEDGADTFQVKDSLVFIDTDMTFEDFAVRVIN